MRRLVAAGDGAAARTGGRERLPAPSGSAWPDALRRGVAALLRGAAERQILPREVLLKPNAIPPDVGLYCTGEGVRSLVQ